ncbi:MopE-related protein [Desulfosarcina variabilis]|uniref:MopE-related protein n=1 Tax=Desulfosarcina variabilis TaxID=2300 RepID=UPI003AFAA680
MNSINVNDTYGDSTDSVVSETQPEGYVSDDTDCDDADAFINPGAEEACNGIEDDCDNQVDEGRAEHLLPGHRRRWRWQRKRYAPGVRAADRHNVNMEIWS